MMIFMLLLLGVAVAAVVSFQKSLEVSDQQLSIEAEQLLRTAASTMDTVFLEGNGFRTELVLPATLAGRNYTVRLEQNTMIFTIQGQDYTRAILAGNVTGTLAKGRNWVANIQGGIQVS